MQGLAVVMLAAGIGIPVLAALNAALGQHINAPMAAGCILFCVALIVASTVTTLTGQVSALGKLTTAPKHLFLAGALVAFYVLSITAVAPKIGIGNAVFLCCSVN